MKAELEPRFFSPRRAALYLDVSLKTLYAWAADGTLKGVVRIRRRNAAGRGRHQETIRISKARLDAFLERRMS